MRLPFEYDPDTRTSRYWHIDNVDPRHVALESIQDTKPYYEVNQKIRNMSSKLEIPRFGRAVAEIPFDDYAQLCKDYPDLNAKGPGAREVRQAALQKILTTHPKRYCWLWQDNFYGKKKKV